MSDLYDYDCWANFSKKELVCKHTGLENPNVMEFTFLMDMVQLLRTRLGIPIGVSSAYRHPTHPTEAKKKKPGMHSVAAIDLHIPGPYIHDALKMAIELGFTGIGVNYKGARNQRFLHLDFRETPMVWSY